MIVDITAGWAIFVAVVIVIAVWILGKFRLERVIRYKMKEMEEKGKTAAATVPPAVVAAKPRAKRRPAGRKRARGRGRRTRRAGRRRRARR